MAADALQANPSVHELAHISVLTSVLLPNHNQPVTRQEMSHIPTLRIDVPLFTVGFVTSQRNSVRKELPQCNCQQQNGVRIHFAQIVMSEQNSYLLVTALKFPAAKSNESVTA